MTKILFIDDEPYMRVLVSDFLSDTGYDVRAAQNGREGLEMFQADKPDLVLTDLYMPNGDGFMVLEHIAWESPDTPVVIISGAGAITDAIRTLRLGAWDFVRKPLTDHKNLLDAIDNALGKSKTRHELRQYWQNLASKNAELEQEVQSWSHRHEETVKKIEQAMHGSFLSLAQAVEAKDPYTAGHSFRVATIAAHISRALGLDKQAQDLIHISGILHDIGKIGVPEAILNKASRLTPAEFEEIKLHVIKGVKILEKSAFSGPVADIVLQHHERFDGAGYPHGLSGEEIMIEARIIAVADVYEALTSDRPYRPKMTAEYAGHYIRENKATHFCPKCVDAFLDVLAREERQL